MCATEYLSQGWFIIISTISFNQLQSAPAAIMATTDEGY